MDFVMELYEMVPPITLPSDIGTLKREVNILDTAIWVRTQGKLILVCEGQRSVG